MTLFFGCRLQLAEKQHVTNTDIKGRKTECKRRLFMVQKTVFRNAINGLLQNVRIQTTHARLSVFRLSNSVRRTADW